tara:strand:- start:47910 stop:50498 length:2589 start_codon:yes stop_codon:yes gene_type:complete
MPVNQTESSSIREQLQRRGTMRWIHFVIVLLSLALTVFAWYYSRAQLNAKVEMQFEREADQAVELVLERMRKYEEALLASSAFVLSIDTDISHGRWRRYVDQLQIHKRYPGINGLGIIYKISRDEVPSFLAKQRSRRPNFSIHPEHERDTLWPITHIVPVRGNEEAVGLDMSHEENRRTAAEKSETTRSSQITGPITLVQDEQRSPGFLFYTPFYRSGIDTKSSRTDPSSSEDQFGGLIYAPFVMRKLMRGTVQENKRPIGMRIHDGKDLLFDELVPSEPDFDPHARFEKTVAVPLYGRVWNFNIRSGKSFRDQEWLTQPTTILLTGLLINSLLIWMFFSISQASRQSLQMADQLTSDLTKVSFAAKVNRIGIWDFNPNTKQLQWDDTMFSLYGCKRETFKSDYESWYQTVHPDDRDDTVRAIEEALAGRQPFDVMFRVIRDDGSIRHVGGQAVVFRDKLGNPIRMLGANTDVTDRMQMAGELEDARQLQNAIQDAAAVAIIAVDLEGTIIHFSPGAERMLGYEADEVVGKKSILMFHDAQELSQYAAKRSEETGRAIEPDLHALTDEVMQVKISQHQWTYLTRTGDRIPVLATTTAIRDKSKQVKGFLAVAADITDRIDHLKQIEEANINLARSNDELAQFAYVASHDLQAPLRRIISLSDLLRDEIAENLSEEGEAFMSKIESSAERMRGLILDLLAYSRVESTDIELVPCDVNEIVRLAIENLSEVINDVQGKVDVGDMPTISADSQQLLQLFQNLIGNAMKYRSDAPPEVQVRSRSTPTHWYFSIADNGIGIAPDFRERVFGVFKRLHTDAEFAGNGIGLAICKRIIERFKGNIWISDSELGGTKFEFRIPKDVEKKR